MSERVQARKTPRQTREAEAPAKSEHPNADAARDHLADLDELLDEIDEVLEENAETFVKEYVQKGGQ